MNEEVREAFQDFKEWLERGTLEHRDFLAQDPEISRAIHQAAAVTRRRFNQVTSNPAQEE